MCARMGAAVDALDVISFFLIMLSPPYLPSPLARIAVRHCSTPLLEHDRGEGLSFRHHHKY